MYPFTEENLRKEAHKIIITMLCCLVQLEAMLLYAAYKPLIQGPCCIMQPMSHSAKGHASLCSLWAINLVGHWLE